MAPPTPTQLAWRARIETALRVAGPMLDLVLAVGDRISRVVDREPPAPEPLRAAPIPPQRSVGSGHVAGTGD